MELQEGQVYEGRISPTGGEGPLRLWLVVAPFGNTQLHSIDDPLDTHCWPGTAVGEGMAHARVSLVGYEPDHPMIRLQRAKEACGIRDTAPRLPGDMLEKMVALMKQALVEDREVALYAAGEIIGLIQRTPVPDAQANSIEQHIGRPLDQRTGKDATETLTH